MKQLAVLLICVSLIGCANHKKKATLEEMDTILRLNKEQATRFYPGKTQQEVRKASQQVFELLDPADVKFDLRDNELLVTRFYMVYAVLSAALGRDWYSVSFESEQSGTKATFGFDTAFSAGIIVAPIPESFKSKIPASTSNNPSDFKLFHDRVEFMLGLRKDWVTCDMAKQEQIEKERMFLCDSVGLDNLPPGSKINRN